LFDHCCNLCLSLYIMMNILRLSPRNFLPLVRRNLVGRGQFAPITPILQYACVSSNDSSKSNDTQQNTDEKQDVTSKIVTVVKKYGALGVVTYLGIYVGTLASMFYALDNDVFNAASVGLDYGEAISKVCDVFETVTGNTHLPEYIRENPRVGTFCLGWAITKIVEPIRLGATLAILPSLHRWRTSKSNKENDPPNSKI